MRLTLDIRPDLATLMAAEIAAGDNDPVARPRFRHLGDAEIEPRRF